MAPMTEEAENYVKICFLLAGISQHAARVYFDSEFDPSCLEKSLKKEFNKLFDLKKDRTINQSQWNLLFPLEGCVPNSNTFDITLIITLLRNLTNLSPPEKGFDKLPSVTNSTPSAALATLKYYRNYMSHIKNAEITSSYFNKAWDDITGAVGRLGGTHMLEECNELRKSIFEPSIVPWNIRVQIKQILEVWKTNNSTFVETRAAKHVQKCIQENCCVTITASSGVGKTATLQHVALKMADEGYDVLILTDTHDIVKFYNPNQKTLFVMDDFCGTYSINQFDLNSLESVMKRITQLLQNKLTKIIVACRLQVYQDEKFESLSIFRTCVCNLQSEVLVLTKTEKKSIAELYLETKSAEIIEYCDLFDCFPLLCKLNSVNPVLNITDFFQKPFLVYEDEIDNLLKKGHFKKYCALALCVIFDNKLEAKWLTDEIDTEKRIVIENTCEACKLDRGTSRLSLLDEIKTLEHTFIMKEQNVYKALHDKLFDFLTFYFGKKMVQCLIRNADIHLIQQRFILNKQEEKNQFSIVLPIDHYEMYIQRMIDDWYKRRVRCVFMNTNMNMPKFRYTFLMYLKTLNISFQEELALICDFQNKDTALLQCCTLGDIPLIKWCIEHGADVNQCDAHGVNALVVSAAKGYIEIVKLLLDNKADINMCTNDGMSPLSIACCLNKEEIVKLLLDTAEINKYTDDGASSLHLACMNNHIKIVKMLLDNKTDPNKCIQDGVSPLFVACENNHIEIVKMLLDNKADTNKCIQDGVSPLFVACQNNHIEIVNILLDNKADTNKCIQDGVSPLFVACQNNHIEIVKMLLDNKADINKCNSDGASPLYLACQENNFEVVRILLDNNVDVNSCIHNGPSPLLVACQNNHMETVKLLLDNKADINKSNDDEVSPLIIACEFNNKEVVKVLLDNQADINKCSDKGGTSLHIACKKNHIDLTKLLLENKAAINKYDANGATPLLTACMNNNIQIVELLLNNDADVHACSYLGISPLAAAKMNNNIDIVRMLMQKGASFDTMATIAHNLHHSFGIPSHAYMDEPPD